MFSALKVSLASSYQVFEAVLDPQMKQSPEQNVYPLTTVV